MVLFGYGLAFGSSIGGLGLLGNVADQGGALLGLRGLTGEDQVSGTIPTLAFVAFQSAFAIIAVALISGAVADRMKFGALIAFAAVWATVVYFPAAHWVFAFDSDTAVGGWIANQVKALDFAGGTAIHINAGAAALALVLVLGNRRGFGADTMRPHNLPMTMIGSALLFVGWFGFNAGDSLDVVGVHLVGGLVGTLLIGFLADPRSPAGVAGLFHGGGIDQLWRQAVGAFSVLGFSFGTSYLIAKALDLMMGLRVPAESEDEGIDRVEHAESAYDLYPLSTPLPRKVTATATPAREVIPTQDVIPTQKEEV